MLTHRGMESQFGMKVVGRGW